MKCAVVVLAGGMPVHVYATFPSRDVAEEWVARKNEAQGNSPDLCGVVVPLQDYEEWERQRR